jgi:mannose-1-phosphate guanylyltransferase/mannose-6-phosphate isomerase
MTLMPPLVQPIILSGGSGTRLWPLSRELYPKQFLALAGDLTLFQQTALRAARPGYAAPIVICNQEHRFTVADQLQAISVAPQAIVLEPLGRNTAPAAAIAALIAESLGQPRLLIMPSDHIIADPEAFSDAVGRARAAAAGGAIVTFGVQPTRPETGYGYIRKGAPWNAADGCFHVERFVEKPSADKAAAYAASGEYLWNSGIFLFDAPVFLTELQRFHPDLVDTCRQAVAGAVRDLDFTRLSEASFAAAPSISIDHAVMERTANAAVVPVSMTWSDLGSWSALWDQGPQDDARNVLIGNVVTRESTGSLVHSKDRLTVLVGVEDTVVVVTDDAVLVADRNRSQDVKIVAEALKASARPEAASHVRVHRPWGHYQALDAGDGYQVKQIEVKPGHKLSLQLHHRRAEHWVVVQGLARVTRGDEVFDLRANESTFIPVETRHRLENIGAEPLRLIEIQSGNYLGEDDIVRFEDVYGRN